jgi:hypothetical protein
VITSRSARPPSASSEPMPARMDAAHVSSARSGPNTEFPVAAVTAPRHQPHEGPLRVRGQGAVLREPHLNRNAAALARFPCRPAVIEVVADAASAASVAEAISACERRFGAAAAQAGWRTSSAIIPGGS